MNDKIRATWASGDYAAVADTVIPDLGQALVDACDLGPGQRVLDVAAGTGNAAVPAALTGAIVCASDITPELLKIGAAQAERAGVTGLTWEEADAEALPYADGEYDAVLSCVGVMFAPHHQQAADELVRVLRPGGTLGLVSWTPEGFIGQMFATMKPYAPAPPAGASPPPLWGREEHVTELLGDRVRGLSARRRALPVDRFAQPQEFLDFFKAAYGPTIGVYASLADQPDRVAELDAALLDLADRHLEAGVMGWEYLLVTAERT